ncbi:hypothetical protein F2P56_012719 [Juglans regia]|uniref:CCHC-type domain-containing protein n=1 Tax=Juglans regia TaxID=51240 RepID=A0A834CZ15_JUGRE|nr:hypothetical protein F2P56_012719 [Juglans regia]
MASATNTNTQPISSTKNPLVVFNITAQINEKLTPSTFPQWRAQFEALLIGYDLEAMSMSKRNHWIRQDKLILSAILTSTSTTITPLIATVKTSQEAWKKLKNMYANDDLTLYILNGLGLDFRDIAAPIRAREKSLAFEELHDLLVGHESYLRCMEVAATQLVAAANFTSRNPNFHDNNSGRGASRTGNGSSRGSSRIGNGQQKDYPCPNNSSGCNTSAQKHYQPKCQFCYQLGHTAKSCPQLQSTDMSANYYTTSRSGENKWLINSAASHNITGDLSNLSIHSEYDGTDEVVLGDGTGLTISHIGSLA